MEIMCNLALSFCVLIASVFAFAETPIPSPEPTSVPPLVETKAPQASVGSSTKPEPNWTGEAALLRKDLGILFDESRKVNSKDHSEKTKVRKLIDDWFDWEKIAEECLGPVQWKKQPAGNRESFLKLLKDVIQRTAYTRLDKFWQGAQYRIVEINLTGETGQVTAEFLKAGDLATLEYKMLKKKTKWLIGDLKFEGEQYSQNINQQITAFLRANSFAVFLDKLRKRRDELAADVRTPKG